MTKFLFFTDFCVFWSGAYLSTRWGVCLLLVTPPLLGSLTLMLKSKSKLCYDRRSVSQSLSVSNTHLGLKTRFLLLSHSCGFIDVRCPLCREEVSVVYNCCWPSPAQSFSSPSPVGLMTVFYCLRCQTPTTWSARSLYLHPLRTLWPSYTSSHWVSFSSPPRTPSSTVEVFESSSTRGWLWSRTGVVL
jgi:hypothetical protein